jgi:hypothetical protein
VNSLALVQQALYDGRYRMRNIIVCSRLCEKKNSKIQPQPGKQQESHQQQLVIFLPGSNRSTEHHWKSGYN